MKQKYTLVKDDEKKILIIKEFAELDKEILSFLCEEKFEEDTIRTAISKGKPSLIATLRTHNMYPPALYSNKIADLVIAMYNGFDDRSADNLPTELFFDDLDFLTKEHDEPDIAEEIEEEPDDIDELLEDEIEDDFDDKDPINNINAIKIADDESLDVDEDA
ncbi:hypothetical protein [Desulfonema magnum]|uniref:Uncharacterized protein n=1 Tax=Desulfonema magnum TaxID=45655 RepID=A0A975BW06_9BACT|nr:hypothetical protein [Desulfonema magnum]QTA92749.1 Uncharacterized protein dnm_088380 [Desulfonema magnum]